MKQKLSNNNIGKWNYDERKKFDELYLRYGNAWKNIATFIPSRTITQIKSHGQKYLKSKLNKKKFIGNDKKKLNIHNNSYYNIIESDWSIDKFENFSTKNNSNNELDQHLYLFDINKLTFRDNLIGIIENLNNILEEITNLYDIKRRLIQLYYLEKIYNFYYNFLKILFFMDKYYELNTFINNLIKIIRNKIKKIQYYKFNKSAKFYAKGNNLTLNYYNNNLKSSASIDDNKFKYSDFSNINSFYNFTN